MQKHSVTGVHGSDQRGYDCGGISAAICLLTCLLWQIVALAHCASSSMSVMNRVNEKARGAAANNVLGMMPSMFPGQMVPQMMQMGLPVGAPPMMGMMQPQAGQDDHDSEEEESRSGAAVPTAVPKANAPTASSDVLSDVAGVGDAQGGLQQDGVHHQTMSVKLHQSLICAPAWLRYMWLLLKSQYPL